MVLLLVGLNVMLVITVMVIMVMILLLVMMVMVVVMVVMMVMVVNRLLNFSASKQWEWKCTRWSLMTILVVRTMIIVKKN